MGKIGIIIQREFNERVRKRSFIIMTIITPLLMLGLMATPALIMTFSSSNDKTIAVIDNSGMIAQHLENDGGIVFLPTTESLDKLKTESDRDYLGILVIGENVVEDHTNLQLYTFKSTGMETESNIRSQIASSIEKIKLQRYDIPNLAQIMKDISTKVSLQTFTIGEEEDRESSSAISSAMAYIFGFMIYMFVFIYGAMVLQGVIEEKSSKVIEVMISSVKPFELMMGKILGIASVALTQLLIWAVIIVIFGGGIMSYFSADMVLAAGDAGSTIVQNPDFGKMSGVISQLTDIGFMVKIIGCFIIFFIGGYLLYASMFAAIGSAVDNIQDAQQMQVPITIPIILALVVMMEVLRDPNSTVSFWFSIIPFTSPIIMMARIPFGVPAWQIGLSMVTLYATFIFMVWFAGKVYRVGIFMYGKKPTLKEIIRWSRYKY